MVRANIWSLSLVLLNALFLFFVLLFACISTKWTLVGRWTERSVFLYSARYLAKWTVDNALEVALQVLHAVYASLFLPPWYVSLYFI